MAKKKAKSCKTNVRLNVDDPKAVFVEVTNDVGQVILTSKPYKSEAYARNALKKISTACSQACLCLETCAPEEIANKKVMKKKK